MQRTADEAGWDMARVPWTRDISLERHAHLYAVSGAIAHQLRERAAIKAAEDHNRRRRVRGIVDDLEAGRPVHTRPDDWPHIARERGRRAKLLEEQRDPARLEAALGAIAHAKRRTLIREARRTGKVDLEAVEAKVRAEVERCRANRESMVDWRADAAAFAADLHAKRRAELREMVLSLVMDGFRGGGPVVGGRWREPIFERGLRSRRSQNVAMFVQRIRRRPLVGMTKAESWLCDSKALGLSEPYVAFNTRFWSMIRIDLDRNFASWEALRAALEAVGLPTLPHLVVADVDPVTGAVIRPHLIYHLPWGSAVWNEPSDPRCREAPRRLFRAVHRGLVDALLPLGADPGGLSHAHHGKNPCSPYWICVSHWATAASSYLTLSDWAKARRAGGDPALDLTVTTEVLHRRAASLASLAARGEADQQADAGRVDPASNLMFNDLQRLARLTLADWHANSDPRYAPGDRKATAASVRVVLEDRAREIGGDESRILATSASVANFEAAHWRPRRDDRSWDIARGRDAHEHDLGATVRDRQVTAALRTAQARSEACRQEVIGAVRRMSARGESTTPEAVAREVDAARRARLRTQ